MCISLVYTVQLYYNARCKHHKNAGNVRYNIMGMPSYIYLPDTFILLVVSDHRKTKTNVKWKS